MEVMVLEDEESPREGEIADLLSYIKELEEQNKHLRKIMEDSDWQIAHLKMLHESLLSRIYQMRKLIEEEKEPPSEREEKMKAVLAATTKTKGEIIREQIFEDEEFKRELEEAREFARAWRKKKGIAASSG